MIPKCFYLTEFSDDTFDVFLSLEEALDAGEVKVIYKLELEWRLNGKEDNLPSLQYVLPSS